MNSAVIHIWRERSIKTAPHFSSVNRLRDEVKYCTFYLQINGFLDQEMHFCDTIEPYMKQDERGRETLLYKLKSLLCMFHYIYFVIKWVLNPKLISNFILIIYYIVR